MNSLKLKETVNQIHLGEKAQEEIIRNTENLFKARQQKIRRMKKAAVTAAAFALVLGAAIPIQAGIRYLLKERMENISKQELAEVRQMLQAQEHVEADSFSREYSSEERIRMQHLEEDYQNGTFPEQTIVQTDSSDIAEDSLCYISDTGTFHLPERALTDEELLQIIDFKYTSDYALAQGTAAEQAREQYAQEERRIKKKLKDEGGITEKDAEKAAAKYLEAEFGVSAEDAQVDIFLYQQPGGMAVYHVSYQIQDKQSYYAYGIDLNAEDGRLLDTSSAVLPIK